LAFVFDLKSRPVGSLDVTASSANSFAPKSQRAKHFRVLGAELFNYYLLLFSRYNSRAGFCAPVGGKLTFRATGNKILSWSCTVSPCPAPLSRGGIFCKHWSAFFASCLGCYHGFRFRLFRSYENREQSCGRTGTCKPTDQTTAREFTRLTTSNQLVDLYVH